MSDKDSSQGPRVLYPLVLKALNTIKRPSTPEEITELLNRNLGKNDTPFRAAEVAQQLETMEGDVTLRLFWLRSRPRR